MRIVIFNLVIRDTVNPPPALIQSKLRATTQGRRGRHYSISMTRRLGRGQIENRGTHNISRRRDMLPVDEGGAKRLGW